MGRYIFLPLQDPSLARNGELFFDANGRGYYRRPDGVDVAFTQVTQSMLDAKASRSEISTLVTNAIVAGSIDLSSALTNYAQSSQVAGLVQTAISSGSIDLTSTINSAVETSISNGSIDLSGYVTTAELNTAVSNVTVDLSGYVQTSQVNSLVETAINGGTLTLTGVPTSTEFDGLASSFSNLSSKVDTLPTSTQFNSLSSSVTTLSGNYTTLSNTVNNLPTKVYVDQAVADAVTSGTVDLSNYVTQTELTTALDSASSSGKIIVTNWTAGTWTLPAGWTAVKEYSGTSLKITHNKAALPVSWSGFNKAATPFTEIVSSSTRNMQVLDENTVIITQIGVSDTFELNLIF